MAKQNQEKVFSIRVDMGSLHKDAAELNTELGKVNKQMKDMKKTGDEGSVSFAKAATKQRDLKTSLRETNKAIDTQKKENKAAKGSNESLRSELALLTKQYNKLGKEQRDNTKSGKAMQKQMKSVSDELKKNESSIGDNRREVGNYSNALGSIGGSAGRAVQGIVAMTKAAWAFIATPIGLIIGAIALALAAVAAAFTRTQGGIDTFERGMTAVTTTVDVLLDRFAKVGTAITKIFSGDIMGGLDDLKEAFSGIADEIEREVSLMDELIQKQQRLKEEQNSFIVTGAKLRRQYQELRKASEDRNKPEAERIALLRKANQVQKELADQQESFIVRQVQVNAGLKTEQEARDLIAMAQNDANDITREMIGLSETTEDQRREFLELVAQVDEVQAVAAKKQILNITKIQTLEEQVKKREQKKVNDFFKAKDAMEAKETQALLDKADRLLEEEEIELAHAEVSLEIFGETEKEKTERLIAESKKRQQIEEANRAASIQGALLLSSRVQALTDEGTVLAKAAGLTEATVNTYVGATAALSLPVPLNFAMFAATVATGLAAVQKILTAERGGIMKKMARGGASYLGIIGGQSHSMGGTKFYGEDGTRFEAEKGELIAVVNKRNTSLLNRLSDLNTLGGNGDAFMGRGGTFLQAGGIAERSATGFDVDVMTNVLSRALLNLPPGQIEVVEIATGLRNAEIIENRATG